MLTHLLFSISALMFMLIFMVTYFSYKKETNSLRSKVYVYMIYLTLGLTLIEIIEGITYVYNVSIIFSLTWKLHSIIMILFVQALFYYLLSTTEQSNSLADLIWDSKKIFSFKNLLLVIFVIITLVSMIIVKTYPMKKTMFYFYTNQSILYLLIIYAVYILYNMYIIFLKINRNNIERNDYIVLIGTFLLFFAALIFENMFSEISIYSTLFTLVLILIYYFKENEDLLIIEELNKSKNDLTISNNSKINYLNELVTDLSYPLKTFKSINMQLENCEAMTDDELDNNINSLNSVSTDLVNVISNQKANKYDNYRIDELVYSIRQVIEPSVRQKDIKFTCNIDQTMPYILYGDQASIQRIIVSLLNNAVKYTKVGRVVLNLTGEKRKDSILLNIKVSDTGVGIKQEDFNKVFSKNTGNVASVRKCVEELNGTISFESFYNSGTIFNVSVEQKIVDATPISDAPALTNKIEAKDCNNKRVILLSDDCYSSKKLTSILKKYNLIVDNVGKGMDIINMIKGGEEYDLIILDENTKDINILEVGQSIKQLGKIVNIPPLVAIVINDKVYSTSGIFDEYLVKPINIKKLNEIIEKRCI